jgi:hypothetical protein
MPLDSLHGCIFAILGTLGAFYLVVWFFACLIGEQCQ